MLTSWHASLIPSLFNQYTKFNLLIDVISPLLHVLAPSIRPTAARLLNSEEKKAISELVDSLITFGLRFQQE